jgi:uncharacterized repeat protein (TIGR03803 family)
MSTLRRWKPILFLCVFCIAGAITSPATTFTSLVSFDKTNGANPVYVNLVQGTDGNLYGTTSEGGAHGYGTVFKITPAGTLTTIYSFCSKSGCADGEYPNAGLVLATNGNFYGTTHSGGAHDYGTVFEITSGGTLTTLYSFCSKSGCADGTDPSDALIQGTNGNFYGTTFAGGADGRGTVFEITSAGKLTTLASFDNTDGGYPYGGLVQATNGNFYGATSGGGKYSAGAVFGFTSAGVTVLHSFEGIDGYSPDAGLVQATNGDLYGTTEVGGSGRGLGTVYQITSGGAFKSLLSFDSTDGANPYAGVIQATDGNLYGTASAGGAHGYGTVFKVPTAGGTPTTLHSFANTDGNEPEGGLVQATNGIFYGTTYEGGKYDDGTVFSLAVGLGPFVETNPTSGAVGAAVIILGNNLTGSTSVTFNGTAATFKVVSSTEITTTVPKGATTGLVKVKTPKGTLASNVSFRVP